MIASELGSRAKKRPRKADLTELYLGREMFDIQGGDLKDGGAGVAAGFEHITRPAGAAGVVAARFAPAGASSAQSYARARA